jgi:prepilin-type processing-associated H-X9-DG protein
MKEARVLNRNGRNGRDVRGEQPQFSHTETRPGPLPLFRMSRRLVTSPPPRHAGFSRADLMLVVAALFLLLAVVAPMISKSRENSRLVRCTENLNQVTKAVLKYAEDHGRKLPVTKTSPPPGGWWSYKEEVKRYVGLSGPPSTADKIFACPSDRGYAVTSESVMPFWKNPKYSYNSYVFNGVTLPGLPNISGRDVTSIRQPEKTLLVMEWTAHGPLSWHRSLTGADNTPFYNGAESVVGFVDGHVRLIPFHYDGINAAYTRDPIPGYDYKYSGD